MNIRITKHAIERASERTLKAWRACPSDAAKVGLREWLAHLAQIATAPLGGTITSKVKARVRGVLLVLEPTQDGGVALVTVIDPEKKNTRAKPPKARNDKRCHGPIKAREEKYRTDELDSTDIVPLLGGESSCTDQRGG